MNTGVGSTKLFIAYPTVKILVAAQQIFREPNPNSEHLANPNFHISILSIDKQIHNMIHLLNVSLQEYYFF